MANCICSGMFQIISYKLLTRKGCLFYEFFKVTLCFFLSD